jgi:hypothetical protein
MHTAASLAGRRGRRRRRGGGRDRGGGRSDQWSSRSHLGAGIDAGAVALDTATSSFIPSRPNCFVVVVVLFFGVDRVEDGCRVERGGQTIITQQCFDITTIFHISAIRNVHFFFSNDKFVNNSIKRNKNKRKEK